MMRPLVLLRLAHRMQERRGWTLERCFWELGADEAAVATAMRRLFQ